MEYFLKLLLSIFLGIIAIPVLLIIGAILLPIILVVGSLLGSGFVYFKTIRYLTNTNSML